MKKIMLLLIICLLLVGCGKEEDSLEKQVVGTWYDTTKTLAISKIKLYDTKKCVMEDKTPYSSSTMSVYNTNCNWKIVDNKVVVEFQVVRHYLIGDDTVEDRKFEYELYDKNILRIVGSPTTEYAREN